MGKVANIPWQTLLFVSGSLAMDKNSMHDQSGKNSVWLAMLISLARPLKSKTKPENLTVCSLQKFYIGRT